MSANVQIDTSGSSNQQQQMNQNIKTNNPCNLIVNYLPQSVKEHDFNALFSKIGPVKSCKLMYDRQSGYSFGYGFVEYLNEEDAKKALETFNGYQIEHKRLKVAYARPNCEDTKNTNLYIRNIPVSYDEQNLADLFSQFGDVIQVRILRDQNTTYSRRIGFVIMATKQMALLAIQNLDNTIPPNSGNEPIYVKYADEDGNKKKNPGGLSNQQFNNYRNQQYNNYQNSQYQQGFNVMQQQSNFQNHHLNMGKMKSNRNNGHQNRYNPIGGANNNPVNINNPPLNNPNNVSNGNGYNAWNIGMATAIQPQQGYSNFGNPNPLLGNSGFDNLIGTIGGGAAQGGNGTNGGYPHHPNMHPQMQHGSNGNYMNTAAAMAAAAAAATAATFGSSSNNSNLIDVNSLTDNKPGLSYNSPTIYVYGIGPHATESDLYLLFSNYGRILRVNVIKNGKTGQSKGYGFVVFETFEEANLAVHSMNGYLYNNRPLQVSFKSFVDNIPNFVSSNKNKKNKNTIKK